MKDNIQFNVDATTRTIELLEGKAAKPVELSSYSVEGNLDAPRKFYEKNKNLVAELNSLVLVNQVENTITLICGYNHPHERRVKGKLLFDPDYKSLAVNSSTTYTREKLVQRLKFMRRYFGSPASCNSLVNSLQQMEMQFSLRLEQKGDNRGNQRELAEIVAQEVSVPETFILDIPVLLGGTRHEIEISIYFAVANGKHLEFWLESIQARDLEHELAQQTLHTSMQVFEEDSNLPVLFQ